jgi:uroporphyrinogen decarboxylase
MKNQISPRSMSFWRHFYDREETEKELTHSMIEWQEKWKWDFIKINPPACYHVLDWGAEYQFFKDPLREPELIKPLIQNVSDVSQLKRLDVHSGMLGRQLRVVRNLRSHFGPDLPLLETVFSPLEIAHRLMSSREHLLAFRRTNPRELHRMLSVIQDVYGRFMDAALDAGADGIFFATKWASSDLLTWADYEEFGKQYELPLLQSLAQRGAAVILHVCGARTYLQKMLDYPAGIYSYDFDAEGAPVAEDVVASTGKYVLGGVDPEKLNTDLQRVLDRCSQLRSLAGWLPGPSCVLLPQTPDKTIATLKSYLQGLLQTA